MNKEKYEGIEFEVIEFRGTEVLTTTTENPDDEYEGEMP